MDDGVVEGDVAEGEGLAVGDLVIGLLVARGAAIVSTGSFVLDAHPAPVMHSTKKINSLFFMIYSPRYWTVMTK